MFTRNKMVVAEAMQAKWPGQVLDEGFIPFPKRLLRCMGKLFQEPDAIDDLRVLLAIADFARQKLLRLPSYDYLAFIAGMTPENFKARLAVMQKRDWLTTNEISGGVVIDITPLSRLIEKLTPPEAKTETS